jgi:hypothetical protein
MKSAMPSTALGLRWLRGFAGCAGAGASATVEPLPLLHLANQSSGALLPTAVKKSGVFGFHSSNFRIQVDGSRCLDREPVLRLA